MQNRQIRTIIIMAIFSIIGIMVMQVYWFKTAYDLKQRQFNHTVILALQNVAERIATFSQMQVPLTRLVDQISVNS